MEQRPYRRVLWAPELIAMRLLIFHSSGGNSQHSLLQLAIADANLPSRIHKHPENGVTPGVASWPEHLCACVTERFSFSVQKSTVECLCYGSRQDGLRTERSTKILISFFLLFLPRSTQTASASFHPHVNREKYFLIPCSAEASTSSVLEGQFCRLLESTGRVHPFTVRQS